MNRNIGLGILEILIAVAIIAVIVTWGFSGTSGGQGKSMIETETNALKQAKALRAQSDQKTRQQNQQFAPIE